MRKEGNLLVIGYYQSQQFDQVNPFLHWNRHCVVKRQIQIPTTVDHHQPCRFIQSENLNNIFQFWKGKYCISPEMYIFNQPEKPSQLNVKGVVGTYWSLVDKKNKTSFWEWEVAGNESKRCSCSVILICMQLLAYMQVVVALQNL